ncbi:hypothetical protein PTTG_06763 [Puccinia triticina 1-1 BBBD Race 1]|uniref:BED-type domain-containing protein n=1 Tax=Puccinia triticina (isolate 1-1 / race 1 (BBBD)) TaxID=630390 RepID=A0A180H3C8_PUCT1|nr:hypothetical protein PTTG_06763 [Puccinia triticina 1-1 BBBD Race 1]
MNHQLLPLPGKANQLHQNSLSTAYSHYKLPFLSDQPDKHGRKMIVFPCKTCNTKIHHPTYNTSPTNLSKHVANCLKQLQEVNDTTKLAALGISGTGD